MERQEFHLYIHLGNQAIEVDTLSKRQSTQRRGIQKEPSDFKTAIAQTFWARNLDDLFKRGFPIWYHLKGTWADRLSGGSNDGAWNETEEIGLAEKMQKKFASAQGLHISKERLVDAMIKCGLRLAMEKGYERAVMEQYLESRVQLLAEGYGIKNDETIANLKGLIYQGRLSFAS